MRSCPWMGGEDDHHDQCQKNGDHRFCSEQTLTNESILVT
jgi:hypothetical protein